MRRLFLALPLFISACEPAPKTPALKEPPAAELPASVKSLTPNDAERFLAAHPEALVIDARTLDEWQAHGHISKARRLDYLDEKSLPEVTKLDSTKPCLVYCAIGGRARFMAAELVKMGFTDLQLLDGGFNAWVAAGKPVEK